MHTTKTDDGVDVYLPELSLADLDVAVVVVVVIAIAPGGQPHHERILGTSVLLLLLDGCRFQVLYITPRDCPSCAVSTTTCNATYYHFHTLLLLMLTTALVPTTTRLSPSREPVPECPRV